MTPDAAHMSYLDPYREAVAPRAKNETFASLVDAGKLLFAKLTEKSRKNRWLKIYVQIYMREL